MTGRFFKVLHQSSKSKARLGEIKTARGVIKTPAFVPVATKGSIKALWPELIRDIKIQVAFVNTYHLVTHPGAEIIRKAGGIHKFANLQIPLMSDSGGFQVFSLARSKKGSTTHFLSHESLTPNLSKSSRGPLESEKNALVSPIGLLATQHLGEEIPLVVKISDDGVKFRSTFDGELIEFTPKKSIEYQQKIGADMMMAFDECTYYPSTYKYAKKAMERTHGWLKRCIDYKHKFEILNTKSQTNPKSKIPNPKRLGFKNSNLFGTSNLEFSDFLYGIIQGGTYEDLRKQSAEFVVSQNTDGVAIGGVSVGETKKEMRDQVRWVSDYLPKDRPVHLLGVGQIDDIIDLVKYGVDTFDCVEPTRLGRMGQLYKISNFEFLISKQFSSFQKQISKTDNIDILKGKYRYDLSAVDENCNCYVCQNFTKSYLHHLFKQRELLGYTLATYHNLWVMERLFDKIRILIGNDQI